MSTMTGAEPSADPYTVRPLDATTWDAFAELVERNGGVFGGCWCMSHHETSTGESFHLAGDIDKRATKETLVRSGRAHAALEGALDLIAQEGGGTVEAKPELTAGRAAQGRFLFVASVELFEDYGFERVRQLGKWAWLVRRHVDPVQPI